MAEYKLKIHTCNFDASQPDHAVGHDWTISRDGAPMFYEGKDQMNLGEARKLAELLNKAGCCQTEWDKQWKCEWMPPKRRK